MASSHSFSILKNEDSYDGWYISLSLSIYLPINQSIFYLMTSTASTDCFVRYASKLTERPCSSEHFLAIIRTNFAKGLHQGGATNGQINRQ